MAKKKRCGFSAIHYKMLIRTYLLLCVNNLIIRDQNSNDTINNVNPYFCGAKIV
jgi:hypothetical protein